VIDLNRLTSMRCVPTTAQALKMCIVGLPLLTHLSITSTRRGNSSVVEANDSSGAEEEPLLTLEVLKLPDLGNMVMSSLWLQKQSSDMKPIKERRFRRFAASSNNLIKVGKTVLSRIYKDNVECRASNECSLTCQLLRRVSSWPGRPLPPRAASSCPSR
jgi:hypothetical protein